MPGSQGTCMSRTCRIPEGQNRRQTRHCPAGVGRSSTHLGCHRSTLSSCTRISHSNITHGRYIHGDTVTLSSHTHAAQRPLQGRLAPGCLASCVGARGGTCRHQRAPEAAPAGVVAAGRQQPHGHAPPRRGRRRRRLSRRRAAGFGAAATPAAALCILLQAEPRLHRCRVPQRLQHA